MFEMIMFIIYIANVNANNVFVYPFHPDPCGKVYCRVAGDTICGQYGTCQADLSSPTNWSCLCDREHFTTELEAFNHTACISVRPSKTVAVVLAAIPFTGYFGGGAYYLGWNIMGSIQFMFTGFLCLIVCFHGCCKKKKMVVSNSSASNYNIHIDDDKENECLLKCAMWTVYTSMWIVNLVLICNDCMNSNGIPCIPF